MRRATLLGALLLLAACGSTTLGDLGSIFGSPSTSPSPGQSSSVIGVITSVDTNAQRIDLNVSSGNNLRPNSSQSTGSIYYDSHTRVTYQNGNYNVTDLERGDEVSVTGANSNGRYLADVITVTRNVRG
jgi:hypothetical protein